ncbi:MAG: hypothetical protein JSS56_30140 [Proteobacteria bacterium]|nr:hypothetical protein [Pseudomonadota bacterium]
MTSPRLDALLRQCACSTAPEAAFWKGVVTNLNEPSPNWGLDLHPDREPDSVDVFIYLVDTSSLWLAGAAIAPTQLTALQEEHDRQGGGEGAAGSGDLVLAAACIAAASGAGDAAASPEILAAFACAVRAIAASQAYAEAREHECPLLGNHHWMLLLYRLANGEAVAAIGHDDEPYHGMLERSVALECVQRMVEEDLGSSDAAINQAVKRAGGVSLAPELRRLKIA